ncbi:hypothetical protein MMC34_000952 [Xylographa carneopallida]|nr:hypothetical protein [Xylographa carneopallida]
MDPHWIASAAPAGESIPLSATAVDRQVPIFVRIRYVRLDRSSVFDINDMILLDPYNTSLDSLHARLKYLFLTNRAFMMEHDMEPLTAAETELNESGIVCRVLGTDTELMIKIHHENVRAAVMAMAANMQHMFLFVRFGPCM